MLVSSQDEIFYAWDMEFSEWCSQESDGDPQKGGNSPVSVAHEVTD
jgi:hypothetical protein